MAERLFDVAIVGAGMAGAALAAALRGQGLTIALVEARELEIPPLPAGFAVDCFDSRVSALTPQSMSLLTRVGAWPAIAGYRHCPFEHMCVWDAEGSGQVEFDAAEAGLPALGHIVENRAVVAGLLEQVLTSPDITRLAPHRLQGIDGSAESVTLQLDRGAAISARLLVAADGAQSRVRESLHFATREWDYGHRAIVCTVATELAHQHTAWQRFLPSGPLAFLPLPVNGERHLCSIVWSVREALAPELLELDEAGFCEALGRAFEWRLGQVLAASRRLSFPLRQRHAVEYVQPRVALVGDAAHTIHPLAGQGINLGLKDVAVLADEILRASRRGRDPGDIGVLRRYQRQRKGENLLMMGAMDAFKFLFEQQALPLRWLRNAGMSGVDRSRLLKQQIMRHAMGLGSLG